MTEPVAKLLRISEAAARLGVHPTTLRTWADKGMVAMVKLPSGYRRFRVEEIERMKQEMDRGRIDTEGEAGNE